jgi:hypothetical protein
MPISQIITFPCYHVQDTSIGVLLPMVFHHVPFTKPRVQLPCQNPDQVISSRSWRLSATALSRLEPFRKSCILISSLVLLLFSLVVPVARHSSKKLRTKNRFREFVRENGDFAVDLIEKLSGGIGTSATKLRDKDRQSTACPHIVLE